MTYAELLNTLYEMPKDRLEDDITIYIESMDEYFAVTGSDIANEKTNDVLDNGHFFLKL